MKTIASNIIVENDNWKIIPPNQKELEENNLNSKFHLDHEKECIYCKSIFYYGRRNQNSCGLCKIRIKECPQCKKSYDILLSNNLSGISGTAFNELRECIFNGEPYYAFCSIKCLANSNSDKWRKSDKFSKFVRSKEFHTDIAKQQAGVRLSNWLKTENGIIHTKIHYGKLLDTHLQYCKICNKITKHNGYDRCSI